MRHVKVRHPLLERTPRLKVSLWSYLTSDFSCSVCLLSLLLTLTSTCLLADLSIIELIFHHLLGSASCPVPVGQFSFPSILGLMRSFAGAGLQNSTCRTLDSRWKMSSLLTNVLKCFWFLTSTFFNFKSVWCGRVFFFGCQLWNHLTQLVQLITASTKDLISLISTSDLWTHSCSNVILFSFSDL